MLSGCGAEEAEEKRRELQAGIGKVLFEARPGRQLALGISIGAAVFPHDGDSYESLLRSADSRMYQDKATRKRRDDSAGASGAGRGRSTLTDSDIQQAAAGIL